jgi:8-oxo-dGTP pyrophosphatase MutT (NUDIX family)
MPTLMFSEQSSPAVPDSLFYQENFMLGAGMVIIQPSMSKILVIHDERRKYWFLPKGRKDIGESIEQAALREAYEEVSQRCQFLYMLTK